jgi:hypothetical protein
MKAEWKAILDEVKRIASTFAKPQKFETATLEDGTIVEWEGELKQGSELLVVDGENKIKAPIGTHVTTDGTTVIVEEEGVVASVTVKDSEPTPTEMTYEKAVELLEGKFADVDQIALVLKWIFNDMYGWRVREEQSKKDMEAVLQAVSTFGKVPAIFEAMATENEELKQRIEKLEKNPSNPTSEKAKFSREGSNLTARQQFLINNLKK